MRKKKKKKDITPRVWKKTTEVLLFLFIFLHGRLWLRPGRWVGCWARACRGPDTPMSRADWVPSRRRLDDDSRNMTQRDHLPVRRESRDKRELWATAMKERISSYIPSFFLFHSSVTMVIHFFFWMDLLRAAAFYTMMVSTTTDSSVGAHLPFL